MRSLFTKIILLSISFFFLLGTVDVRAQGIQNITECTDFPGWAEFFRNENKNSKSFRQTSTLFSHNPEDSNLCKVTSEDGSISFYYFCKNPNFEFTISPFTNPQGNCKNPNVQIDDIDASCYHNISYSDTGKITNAQINIDVNGLSSQYKPYLTIIKIISTTTNAQFERISDELKLVSFSECQTIGYGECRYTGTINTELLNRNYDTHYKLEIYPVSTAGYRYSEPEEHAYCKLTLPGNTVPEQTDTPPFIPPPQQDPDNPNSQSPNSAPISLNSLNPLNFSTAKEELSTPGGIISRALRSFVFPIAGMILFIMLVWGGFEILSKSTNQNAMQAGKQRITAAIIGFILLFVAYWVLQLIQFVFGISVL